MKRLKERIYIMFKKVSDFFVDLYFYVKTYFDGTIHWLKYHLNKDFLRFLKVVLKSYPYDYNFFYDIQKAKFLEMIHYFEKTQRFEGWEQVVRDLKICVSLLEIITEERDIFHFVGDNWIENEETHEFFKSEDWKYICDVKVNMNNLNRFVKCEKSQKTYKEWPHEFYILKARYLLYKIMSERDIQWWD